MVMADYHWTVTEGRIGALVIGMGEKRSRGSEHCSAGIHFQGVVKQECLSLQPPPPPQCSLELLTREEEKQLDSDQPHQVMESPITFCPNPSAGNTGSMHFPSSYDIAGQSGGETNEIWAFINLIAQPQFILLFPFDQHQHTGGTHKMVPFLTLIEEQ